VAQRRIGGNGAWESEGVEWDKNLMAIFMRRGNIIWPCRLGGAGDKDGWWATHKEVAGSYRVAAQRPRSSGNMVQERHVRLVTSLGVRAVKAFGRWFGLN
jgi:hypothetical protein